METTDFIERFKAIVKDAGGSQAKLAKKLGFSQGNIGDVAKGDKKFSGSLIYAFLENGYSIDWILTGSGTMKVNEKGNVSIKELEELKAEKEECDKRRIEQRKTIENLNYALGLLKQVAHADGVMLDRLANSKE